MEIYRYRKQRGANLGSWISLEDSISKDPFREAQQPAQSDLDLANGNNAKEILEKHWDSWMTDEDWKWLSEHGVNTVRLPIGFYHVCGKDASVLEGTDFAHLYSVFSGAWGRILNAIDIAMKYGIGVLIDLQCAPGKQHPFPHSGQSGPVRFYEENNMKKTQLVLSILARELHTKPNIVGLEILNQPQNDPKLPEWYASTIDLLHGIAPELPIYIHDAWNTQQYAELAGSRPEFVVVDHHLYRCFEASDLALSANEHAQLLRGKTLAEFKEYADKCRGNIIVGEFSSSLSTAFNDGGGDPTEKDNQRRTFANAELDLFEKACAGYLYWTYKMDHADTGWVLKDAVNAGVMPNWFGIKKKAGVEVKSDQAKLDAAKEKSFSEYCAKWDKQAGTYEHWRFKDGFVRGWNDAYLFFSSDQGSSISELGFKGQWVKQRLVEHVKEKGSSNNLWEYEHGFIQGVDEATAVFKAAY
ncbi:glycoside hydrolase [Rickenella mellea]|uniref:Glycoside hydrolase n=1 Tax=Rickenella mellea TaxID=50990 RepID=A0A4Y7QE38_9AGAM|nr:glycoside hydrolase [Rickenella mellea]